MALLEESANGVFVIAATPFSRTARSILRPSIAWSISISNAARTASPYRV
jgi:hypothetical protein